MTESSGPVAKSVDRDWDWARSSAAPSGPARSLLGGLLALAAAMGIGRFAFTPILPAMERAIPLDPAQAGLLASANYAGYLSGALCLTILAPRLPQIAALRMSILGV